MVSFFKRFQKSNINFSLLKTDMHSHLIPGIDDGAKTLQKSIEYIQGMKNLGYQKIITTPHIMGEYYPNTPKIINDGLEEVRAALDKAGIVMTLEAAAEYYVDDFFVELLDSGEPLLTLPGNRLLIEFSTFAPPTNFFEVLFRLNTSGYLPILAHPERYVYYADQFEIFERFKATGCALQINILSLLGHYGNLPKKLAYQLLKTKLVDYIGTDLHHHGHLDLLHQCLNNKKISFDINTYTFVNACL